MFPEVVRGIEQAKKKLSQIGPLDLASLPAEVAQKTRDVFGEPLTPVESVQRILDEVRARGDEAIRYYTRALDDIELRDLEVHQELLERAYKDIPDELVKALELSARRIRKFHQASLPKSWVDFEEGLGELVMPLDRVGIYAPGGTVPYPSTVLMAAIPAAVAGVREVVLATPPEKNGLPAPATLVAASLAGVHRVFAIGGVQAIGALAFGTESVPRVDKICGPGNIFVQLAKKQVFGQVDIDGLYGPTETVVVADETASPVFCAADLLAQAEHDTLATPIFITTSLSLVAELEGEIESQLERLDRKEIARCSLERRGMAVLVDTLEEALELANHIAPEHLCLLVKDPWEWVPEVRHAGGVFLGQFSPEVMGDYVAGPSHVMPTGGTARFRSALGVHQFLKTVPVVGLKPHRFGELGQAASTIARAEGLTGHAAAVEKRLKALQEGQGS